MSTPQDDPGPADAAGTAGDTDASSDNSGTGDDMSADKASAGQGTGQGSGADEVRGWFSGRLPDDWFTAAPEIQADREEITIVGELPAPETEGASDAERAAAAEGRIRRFREETRG